jgi:FAD/FMN-containing dehydrogenase
MYSSSHVAWVSQRKKVVWDWCWVTLRPLPVFQHSILVRVKSTEDVVKVVNISRKFRIPLTVYSGGTSVEGHFAGVSY